MAKQRRTIGSGITARTATTYDGEDMPDAFEAFAREWNAALTKSGGSQFGAVVLAQEQACRKILDAAGNGPLETDSMEHWAQQILRAIEVTRQHIARGDADGAARSALQVGRLVTEARIKGAWEAHALRGEKTVTRFSASATQSNKKKQDSATRRYKQWQAEADRMWKQNKYLSARTVAECIAGKTGGNPNTIRRKIHKQ